MKYYDEENKYISMDLTKYSEEDENKVTPLTTFERVKYLFTDPSRTMKDLAQKPRILFPLFLIIIGVLLSEMILANVTTTNEAIMEIEEQMIKYLTIATLALMPIMLRLFLWFGKVLFVHGVAGVLGGEGTMKGVTSVIGYSYFVNIIGDIIRSIIVVITGNVLVTTSLIALFPGIQAGTPLYVVMQQLNIFTIIYLLLSTIGVMYVHGISKIKSAIAVFGTWIIFVVFTVFSTLS